MNRFAEWNRPLVLLLLIFASSLVAIGQIEDTIYKLPVGTRINLKLDHEVNSEVSSVNDTFLAVVSKPVRVREAIVLPVGTVIEGRVASVERAASGGQAGSIEVVFETLKLSGEMRRIEGFMVTPRAESSSRTRTWLSLVGGIAAGTAIGAASGGSRGALIGAAVGAGAGTSLALLNKGREIRLKKDQEFEIELKKEVLLPVLDY